MLLYFHSPNIFSFLLLDFVMFIAVDGIGATHGHLSGQGHVHVLLVVEVTAEVAAIGEYLLVVLLYFASLNWCLPMVSLAKVQFLHVDVCHQY